MRETDVLATMKFGVFLPFYAFRTHVDADGMFRRLSNAVFLCERLGFDSVWLDDHLMFQSKPVLECFASLSALATVTTSIRLGALVTCAGFRSPGLLAKTAATLDIISNGRLELGLGAGAQKEEHLAYGFTFPESAARVQRLKEAVEVVKKLWTEDNVSYQGKYSQLTQARCEPKPVQKPHPPMIIGGCAEKLLKLQAEAADRFDWGYQPMKAYKEKLKVLQRYCEKVGRDFNKIEKACWPSGQLVLAQNQEEAKRRAEQLKPANVTWEQFQKYSLVGTAENCMERIQEFRALGATYFMLFFPELPTTESLTVFAEKIMKPLRAC